MPVQDDEERKELTLLSLPDVPLLHILSLLPMEDLVPAGMACPRLGALTRTCTSLWRKKKETMLPGFSVLWTAQRVENVFGVVRVLPPIDKFTLMLRKDLDPLFLLDGDHVSKLTASIRITLELVVGAIRELGPRIRVLVVGNISALDVLFIGLQEADMRSLETLDLIFNNPKTSAPWPQEVNLPRLRKLVLSASEMESGCMTSAIGTATIEGLKSLLRAHSGQLRDLSLDEHLIPVLFDFPVGLRRLKVPSALGRGLAAALAQTEGLKELHVDVGDSNDPLLTEVVEFLDSHPQGSQLERLVLLSVKAETLLALLPDRLARIQHLVLVSRYQYIDWNRQLAALGTLLELRLSGLRSLTLRGLTLPYCQVFDDISSNHIPALELLLLSSSCTTLEDFEQESAMFMGLVRRALRDLHTLLLARDGRELRLCRHSESGSSECGLCEEAANILHDGYKGRTPIKVQHVEVR